MDQPEELLTAAKAAEYLGVTPARIHAIRASRQHFGRKIGGVWFYTKQELDEYQATKQRPNPSKRGTRKKTEENYMPGLVVAFRTQPVPGMP